MNKPDVLSEEQMKRVLEEVYEHYYDEDTNVTVAHGAIAQAQRDADVAYYEPLLHQEYLRGKSDASVEWAAEYVKDMDWQRKQTKAEVARGIFEEIGKPCEHMPTYMSKGECILCRESLKSKYLEKHEG